MKAGSTRSSIRYHASRSVLLSAICLLSGLAESRADEDVLRVHEWGTFTSFQDENGVAFTHINTDDEPVPKFVHRLFYQGEFSSTSVPRHDKEGKGVNLAHPEVTMRLETPVTYFHLPRSQPRLTFDLSVEFKSGWLTEFFPQAVTQVNGRSVRSCMDERLNVETVGRLTWTDIRLGDDGEGPTTLERVWLAPRNVRAAQVTVGTESERFLFYRGVGHRDAPLRIVRQSANEQLQLRSPLANSSGFVNGGIKVSRLWLVEITADGKCAFRRLPGFAMNGLADQFLQSTPGTFSDAEFSKQNLKALRGTMQTALVEQGLFDDEAAALLNTWESAYFQSPGLRLFFLLPQSWTDNILPMKLSVPAQVTRVMVGRIELVTPRHRQLIQKIVQSPLVDLVKVVQSMWKLQTSESETDHESFKALASGRGNSGDLGVPVPENYQAFLDLGRFRTSLLLSHQQALSKTSNRALDHFLLEIYAPGRGVEAHRREKQQRENQR